MAHDLLSTKLRVPSPTHHVVRRSRLNAALDDALSRCKLVLVSAPAGYGKTTLLADWAQASNIPVAWLSLGEDDNDVERFFRYLLKAWESVQPAVSESPLGLLLGAMMPNRDNVLTAFVNVASAIPEPIAFVLDDYHLIDNPTIHESLTFLLDHLPPSAHFVLAGRGTPPLPLARYRARQALIEFDAEDIQFRVDEIEAFLRERMGIELTPDAIASINEQLEGWVAGAQMVALTLRRQPANVANISISGRHRHVADYLGQDVLEGVSSEQRNFLLRTSILDRLNGSLCDAVTGHDDGQRMLDRLDRDNLFVIPLDENRDWYRYHRLFGDFLSEELQRRRPDDVVDLHRRAADWYLHHDMPDAAFQHAVAGDDPSTVIRIFERYLTVKVNCGEFSGISRWLTTVPVEWYAIYPLFDLFRSSLLLMTGEFEDGMRGIDDVEQRLTLTDGDDRRWQLALVTTIRCFVACIQNDLARAEVLADRAIRDMREESRAFRANIYHALGDTYRRNGRWEEARSCYLTIPEITVVPGYHLQSVVQSVHVYGALADLELRRGRLRDANRYWQKSLAAIHEPESWSRLELPVVGWIFIRMGELLYEWNELNDAWDYVTRGLARAELGGDVRSMLAGYLVAARLKLTAGDRAAASEYLQRARPFSEARSFPEWSGRFDRMQLECWLTENRLRAAANWADEMLADERFNDHPEPESTQIALARVLIVQGNQAAITRALSLFNRLLPETDERAGIRIEALALDALAHWQLGDRAEALTSLEHALRLAEPEGYLRTFADFGLPMARLLQEARSRGVMADYVATLLAAIGGDIDAASTGSVTLPEPLTDREHEVLELIAAGLTNREIGDRLSISAQTVKKHSGNLYGKLGAHTRTEAVARARDLDLLN